MGLLNSDAVPGQMARSKLNEDMQMSNTTVEISPKWVSAINSPLMWVIWILQGVAVSFAPLFLYWSGQGWFFPEARWVVIPLCFGVILLVFFFYMGLGSSIIKQVRGRTGSS